MNNIKIKIKEEGPSDESILARKDFPGIVNEYKLIKSSYSKVASLWGATIGMTVFLAFAATETIGTKSSETSNLPKKLVTIEPLVESNGEQVEKNENTGRILEKQEQLSSDNEVSTMTSSIDKPLKTSEIKKEKTDQAKVEEKTNEPEKTKKMNVNFIPE